MLSALAAAALFPVSEAPRAPANRLCCCLPICCRCNISLRGCCCRIFLFGSWLIPLPPDPPNGFDDGTPDDGGICCEAAPNGLAFRPEAPAAAEPNGFVTGCWPPEPPKGLLATRLPNGLFPPARPELLPNGFDDATGPALLAKGFAVG